MLCICEICLLPYCWCQHRFSTKKIVNYFYCCQILPDSLKILSSLCSLISLDWMLGHLVDM